MKRMTLTEMRFELDREIEVCAKLSDLAFADKDLEAYFRIKDRMNGLFYARALLHGQREVLGCYESGRNPNSGGATYRGRRVERYSLKVIE